MTPRRLGGGHGADAWLVDDLHVLRRFAAGTSPARALFACAVQARLHDRELGPRPIPLRGQPFYSYGGRLWSASEVAPGRPVQPGERPAALGRLLAEVHEALGGEPLPGDSALMALPAHPADALRDAMSVKGADIEILRRKLQWALRMDRDVCAEDAQLPRGIVHGDFHPGNILLDERRAALIDTDRACAFLPCYEVMRAMVYCVRPAEGGAAGERRARRFLAGYESRRPLTAHERACMADVYVRVQLADTYCLVPTPSGPLRGVHRRHARFRFAALAWVEGHARRLLL